MGEVVGLAKSRRGAPGLRWCDRRSSPGLVVKRMMVRAFQRAAGPVVRQLRLQLAETPQIQGRRDRVHVGADVSLMNTLFNTVSGDIFIGDRTIFGHNVMVLTGTHLYEDGKRRSVRGMPGEVPEAGRSITIEEDCWIGSGAIVLGGVRIGRGARIGAGTVVSRDVPSRALVVGAKPRTMPSEEP